MAEIEIFRARNTTGLAINGNRVTETKPYGLIQTTQRFEVDDKEILKAIGKAADVQEKKYCKMIPLEPDCRSYTDVFICTNCHQHIHLGFIRKEYSGSFCLECGAEVKDGDTECQ